MAEKIDMICGNCGMQTVLFCDNMFTDELCTSCGAKNLFVGLPKLETIIPCKDGNHDIRVARDDLLFCPKCFTEFGKLISPTSKSVVGKTE